MICIYRGLPGSGKTTHAESQDFDVIVEADHFFYVDGEYQFDPSKLTEYHAKAFAWYLEELERSDRIAVDNTNITRAEYTPYVMAARATGRGDELLLRRMSAPCDVCYDRQAHDVPHGVVRSMAQRLAEPEDYDPREEIIRTV